jgi:hypothetical protein
MSRRSAKAARLFGLIMILMVTAWDMDAMRPHIAAHSWYTLAFVALFLAVHLSDYLTVGRLVTRIDPLALAVADRMTAAAHDGPELALNLGHPTAKLYTFTAVTTTVAQASGASYPITRQHFVVKPE